MPLVRSDYRPPFPFRNGHFSTIYSGLLRKVENPGQERERIELDDGDYIDLDWSYASHHGSTSRLVIILHGLEGNAQRPYMLGAAKAFLGNGYDACAVNFRGCSGQTNRLYRSYHSGASDDLERVITHILKNYRYDHIVINGFSLGANVTLKYLGTHTAIPNEIKAAVAVSVPCSLYHSMLALHRLENYLYALKFKKNLVDKLREKQPRFPDLIPDEDFEKIRILRDFDDVYTAKAHGYRNGLDYYEKASSLPHLKHIEIPTLILNAADDSFLGAPCYPYEDAQNNKSLFLEVPRYGGHVGFYEKGTQYYNERRAIAFIEEMLPDLAKKKSRKG